MPLLGHPDDRSLEQRVRDQIGAEGPQLDYEAYQHRIDVELEAMSRAQFLSCFSYQLDAMLAERAK